MMNLRFLSLLIVISCIFNLIASIIFGILFIQIDPEYPAIKTPLAVVEFIVWLSYFVYAAFMFQVSRHSRDIHVRPLAGILFLVTSFSILLSQPFGHTINELLPLLNQTSDNINILLFRRIYFVVYTLLFIVFYFLYFFKSFYSKTRNSILMLGSLVAAVLTSILFIDQITHFCHFWGTIYHPVEGQENLATMILLTIHHSFIFTILYRIAIDILVFGSTFFYLSFYLKERNKV